MTARQAQIRAILFVRDLSPPTRDMVVTGELPGPYPSEAEAVAQLDDGQPYRVVGDLIYALDRAAQAVRP